MCSSWARKIDWACAQAFDVLGPLWAHRVVHGYSRELDALDHTPA